ncbi:MAG: hypothetical protein GVY04_12850 [Cyanobacteria bacterium]|jgi:hypothetical protein|nr:hypothetical protein [Cyanobacteria bacterium GSL.Bin1]
MFLFNSRLSRFGFVIAFLKLLTIATVPEANAQTTQVPFSGSVDTSCDFIGNTIGSLHLSNNGTELNSRSGGTVNMILDCNANGVTLEANQPIPVSSAAVSLENSPYSASKSAEVTYTTTGFGPFCSDILTVDDSTPTAQSSDGCAFIFRLPFLVSSFGQNDITVDISVVSNSPIPAGNYTYRVPITAVVP